MSAQVEIKVLRQTRVGLKIVNRVFNIKLRLDLDIRALIIASSRDPDSPKFGPLFGFKLFGSALFGSAHLIFNYFQGYVLHVGAKHKMIHKLVSPEMLLEYEKLPKKSNACKYIQDLKIQ